MADAGARGPRIELEAATRRFGPLVAVSELSLVLEPGRIHALVGENGAGKSTALKLMAGLLSPSAGAVLVDGQPLHPATPDEAIRRGVGMVHQHFMLVERMTALDNLILGAEPTTGIFGRLDLASARQRATEIGEQTGLRVALDERADALSVGERQRLEILRVLYRGARAVLLDEPTAVLSPVEVGELYATLRQLADEGHTIAVVTHRLDEVVRFCDHVTVMRRGARVLDERLEPSVELTDRLTCAIMGGDVPEPARPPELEPRAPILQIERAGLSLALMPGEVVGVAGIEGNGQRELARCLAGLDAFEGTVRLDGTKLDDGAQAASERVRARRRRGIVVVHEDRQRDELVMQASMADNLVLGDLDAEDDETTLAQRRFQRFDIQPADPSYRADELSGGNQQKLVMARALDRRAKLLVLAQPTRGVDVGTARTIHHAISAAAADGVAVLLISADLVELKSLSHRIVVMRRGRLVAELAPTVGDDEIGRAMLGVTEGDAA